MALAIKNEKGRVLKIGDAFEYTDRYLEITKWTVEFIGQGYIDLKRKCKCGKKDEFKTVLLIDLVGKYTTIKIN